MRRSILNIVTEELGILLSPVEEVNRKDCQKYTKHWKGWALSPLSGSDRAVHLTPGWKYPFLLTS